MLKKYNLQFPHTWDELLTSGKIVLNGEKSIGRNDFVAYNGMFSGKLKFIYFIKQFLYYNELNIIYLIFIKKKKNDDRNLIFN